MTKWTKKPPSEQGWYWYRASNRYHPVPTFIEDVGGGKFQAVKVYDHYRPFVNDVDVEWWPIQITQPKI